ncbi:MAG: hypothetical protein OSB62_00540 [Alphaproteobacteria bacterium]|nr:hypothetical protein [Alphaproteobacteria bacterium]
MAASVATLRKWLKTAKEQQATHLIVVRDIFDQEDHPVFVLKEEDPHQAFKEADSPRMKRVKHVFNVSMDWDEQLKLGTCQQF